MTSKKEAAKRGAVKRPSKAVIEKYLGLTPQPPQQKKK